jgi:hypothetical protein
MAVNITTNATPLHNYFLNIQQIISSWGQEEPFTWTQIACSGLVLTEANVSSPQANRYSTESGA